MRNRNKKSKGRTVQFQPVPDKPHTWNGSSESSPYEEWSDKMCVDSVLANTDSLIDPESDYAEREAEQKDLFARAKALMSERELGIFKLLEHGLAQAQIARTLNITQSAVSMTIRRIRKKLFLAGYKNGDNAY